MSSKKSDELDNYYVIQFEKFIDLVAEIERKNNMLADILHSEVIKTPPEIWDDTAIPALSECYVTVHDIRTFLDDKINNASDEEIKLAQKNNIKDVLITKQDLQKMNVLLLAEEELEARLQVEYKISLIAH